MSNPQTGNNKAPDPFEQWRGMRDAYLDVVAKAMVEGVNTEAYAKASGAMLDAYLTVSTPFRDALEKAMVRALEQLSMPTRADFISLAERLTNLEVRLDDLDIKLDRIEAVVAKPAPPAESPDTSLLSTIESRLDKLDTKLDAIRPALSKSASAPEAGANMPGTRPAKKRSK